MTDHNVSVSYLDQQIARALAVLPAAPAWDLAPLELPCMGFDDMTLYFTYTADAQSVNAAFDFKIEVSGESTGAVWHQLALYSPGGLVAGFDTQSREQREFITYTATSLDPELFVYGAIQLGGMIERVRIFARESGDVNAPGTLEIKARFASEEE
jgi:hypothetical protein